MKSRCYFTHYVNVAYLKRANGWEFIVIDQRDTLGKTASCREFGSKFVADAPLAIVVFYDAGKAMCGTKMRLLPPSSSNWQPPFRVGKLLASIIVHIQRNDNPEASLETYFRYLIINTFYV
ncbi:MAG: hypothetical protein H6543_00360 [Prevotellaceae bacterium]|nr:hypothetical protein [Prevotellaceae bacterium]